MKELLLTLGHNSSAILVEGGRVVAGYEEERLSGVKSDSRFPAKAIARLLGDERPSSIYCTHWDPTADFTNLSGKYWNPEYADGTPVRSHLDNTHHDTHAYAGACFAGPDFPLHNTFIMVVDGFGNFGEHFSLYRYDAGQGLTLVFRGRGYDTSLGLMYQYATAFMGLKMHEDEYKLLGYEVHVESAHAERLHEMATHTSRLWADHAELVSLGSMYDPIFNLAALSATREKLFQHFATVLEAVGKTDPTAFDSRCALAYYVQQVLEQCVLTIVGRFPIQNLILSGGCFYNVKLNRILLSIIPGRVCVYPLAGDQGNALGLYAMDHLRFEFPHDLFWGVRNLKNVGNVDGLEYIQGDELASKCAARLESPGYVNIVRGAMEFGPRALCNTSTLSRPWPHMVQVINEANNRDTVMPMAPVMTRAQWKRAFEHTDKVWMSERYMIMAMEYSDTPNDLLGAAHYYNYIFGPPHYTGRPQVIDDADPLAQLIAETGPLINTSFNYHGKPIAFEMDTIIENHRLQHTQNPHFQTLVVVN